VLVLATPFAVSFTSVDAFRLPKLMLSEWLGLASLLALSLAVALGGSRGRGAPHPWWKEPALLAVAPMVAVATLSWLVGDHPRHSRPAVVDLWIGAACLVGWSLVLDRSRLRRFLAGLAVPATAMAVLAVLQFHGLFRPFAFVGNLERFRLGVTALAGNPGDLGDYLVLGALVAQWGLLRTAARRPSGRGIGLWLWAGALVLAVYGLVASQTLTAAVALVAGSLVFWLRALPRRRALAAVAAALILAVAAGSLVPPLRSRLVKVGREVAAGDWNSALTGRLDGWRAAVWMFEEHPWTGVGQGAYRAEFARAQLALAERGVRPFRGRSEHFFANAHDDYLEAAAEWGLPGLVALAWALWVLLRSLLAGERPGDGRQQAFAWGVVAAGALLALTHFPFHLALVAYPYLLVFAWISRRAREETA
jgi:O-antigen ligase